MPQRPIVLASGILAGAHSGEVAIHKIGPPFALERRVAPVADVLEDQQAENHLGRRAAAAATAALRMTLRQGLIDRRHQLFVRQHRIGMRHPRFAQIIDFRRDQAVAEAQLRAPHLNHGAGLRRLRRGDGSSCGRSKS